ncbi:zf-HC2 domain-containing protein [Williamsia deligens]|uniref:Zf-HC2 domain-containing protein n=1 Tax=Williamsia deligens TaxID=321325 RepID=A0ABW3GF24_9NOCA|nr:zf-HC2 domain-containing protein [Williamsia deligens]MCP2196215.1 putative zinc-finger [Williamsia deligens]
MFDPQSRRPDRPVRSGGLAPHGPQRPPQFAPTDHLAAEAVAAYVDGELRFAAHMRAARHIALCPDCSAEVDAQAAARAALRTSGAIATPSGLLGQLSQIPTREIDMRDAAGPRPSRRGPLSAPGFPVHRPARWRDR